MKLAVILQKESKRSMCYNSIPKKWIQAFLKGDSISSQDIGMGLIKISWESLCLHTHHHLQSSLVRGTHLSWVSWVLRVERHLLWWLLEPNPHTGSFRVTTDPAVILLAPYSSPVCCKQASGAKPSPALYTWYWVQLVHLCNFPASSEEWGRSVTVWPVGTAWYRL